MIMAIEQPEHETNATPRKCVFSAVEMGILFRRARIALKHGVECEVAKLAREIMETIRRRHEHSHAVALDEMPVTRQIVKNYHTLEALRAKGIATVGDILRMGEGRFLLIKNIKDEHLQRIWDRCQEIAQRHN